MFLEKLCTIGIVLFINFLLFRKYVNGYTKINLIVILISIFGFSVYLYSSLKNIILYWYIQIILLCLMIIIPCVMFIFGNRDKKVDKSNVYSKVQKYIFEKRIEKARKEIEKYLESNDEDSQIYFLMGMCDKLEKNDENATTNFMKAIEIDKNNYLAYYELGVMLEEDGKIDTAIVMLTNANRIKPEFYDAAELLGICYTSCKKYDDAEKVYLSALKYHPNSYELNYNIAAINLERGFIDDAEEYLIKATKCSVEPYGACYSLGNIYYKRGKYQNALENYKVARLSEDFSASAYYKMAVIYCKIREYENALICVKYSIVLDKKYLDKAKKELSFDKIIDETIKFGEKVYSLNEEELKALVTNVILKCRSEQFLNENIEI